MRSRQELIRRIVEGEFPVAPLREELAAYPWDADDPLVSLRPDHVRRVVERFLLGELTSSNVQEWAEAVELRDDVDFDDTELDLARLMFILANPEVNGPLTPERARELLSALDNSTA